MVNIIKQRIRIMVRTIDNLKRDEQALTLMVRMLKSSRTYDEEGMDEVATRLIEKAIANIVEARRNLEKV